METDVFCRSLATTMSCFALACLSAQVANAASQPIRAHLANPAVRLWYEETGRLSENIAPPRSFALWNSIIGEGDAEEHANDALFTVDIKSEGERNVDQSLTLTAIDAKGKVLARRLVAGALTSEAGNVTIPLWVRDVGCAGTVTFTAQMGSSRQSVRLDFNCGE